MDWILTLEDEGDPVIRRLLLRTLADDDSISAAALFWTQFCWIVAFAMTGLNWLAIPMAFDVVLFAVRWRIRHLPAPEDESKLYVADRVAVLVNILWIALIAIEVTVLLQIPSFRAVALGLILANGFVGYVSSLYAAFPRLAAFNIASLIIGLMIGLSSTSFTELHLIAYPTPIGGLAYFVLMRRTHRSLVSAVRAQHENRERSLHDPLTGLPNRRLMQERLTRYCSPSTKADDTTSVGILCLDLDGFKGINDRYGHAAGDAVLIHVSKLLRAAARKKDTVSRLGGDEYVVLLPGIDEPALGAIAERIIAAVQQPIDIGAATPVHVGVSIGIACGYRGETPPDKLLSRADDALYDAKRNGKGRFAFAA